MWFDFRFDFIILPSIGFSYFHFIFLILHVTWSGQGERVTAEEEQLARWRDLHTFTEKTETEATEPLFFFSLFLFLFITSIFSLDEMGAYSRFDPILFSLVISPGITQLLRSISLSISLSKILDLCWLPKLSLGRPPPVEWPPATTSPSDQAVPNTCHKRSNVMGF